MKPTYWQKQSIDKPLFPGMLWSRPENRQLAGKLLIVGGSAHGFAAPAEAYTQAEKAGAGVTRVILPSALAKTIGRIFEAGEYAPSTPSGSFAQQALAEILSLSQWSDAVLLAGDFGRNSETAILLEKLVEKYHSTLTLTGDAIDYFLAAPRQVLTREYTVLALTFSQLQKLASAAHATQPFTSQLDLVHFTAALHSFSEQYPASYLLVQHLGQIFVAANGAISSTAVTGSPAIPVTTAPTNTLQTSTHATVWYMQNPSQPYEALTTSLVGSAKL